MGEASRARGRPGKQAAPMEQNLVTGKRCPRLGERARGGRCFPPPGGRRPQEISMGQRASHWEVMSMPSDSSVGGSELLDLLLNTAVLPCMPHLYHALRVDTPQVHSHGTTGAHQLFGKRSEKNEDKQANNTASQCDALPAVAEEDIQGPLVSKGPLVGVLQRTLKNPDELSNGGVFINHDCP